MPKKTAWDKLGKIKIRNKAKIVEAFVKIVNDVQNGKYFFSPGEFSGKKYFLVHEDGRLGGKFIHIVPNETYKIFKELQKKEPDSFLGFSILCGKIEDKEVRVSCFGIPSNNLIRALIKK